MIQNLIPEVPVKVKVRHELVNVRVRVQVVLATMGRSQLQVLTRIVVQLCVCLRGREKFNIQSS